ncbi:MAG: hypothetical protein ACYCVB_12485, partial [Bacilli bacterium]
VWITVFILVGSLGSAEDALKSVQYDMAQSGALYLAQGYLEADARKLGRGQSPVGVEEATEDGVLYTIATTLGRCGPDLLRVDVRVTYNDGPRWGAADVETLQYSRASL